MQNLKPCAVFGGLDLVRLSYAKSRDRRRTRGHVRMVARSALHRFLAHKPGLRVV